VAIRFRRPDEMWCRIKLLDTFPPGEAGIGMDADRAALGLR
jgi:hypothetical protein